MKIKAKMRIHGQAIRRAYLATANLADQKHAFISPTLRAGEGEDVFFNVYFQEALKLSAEQIVKSNCLRAISVETSTGNHLRVTCINKDRYGGSTEECFLTATGWDGGSVSVMIEYEGTRSALSNNGNVVGRFMQTIANGYAVDEIGWGNPGQAVDFRQAEIMEFDSYDPECPWWAGFYPEEGVAAEVTLWQSPWFQGKLLPHEPEEAVGEVSSGENSPDDEEVYASVDD